MGNQLTAHAINCGNVQAFLNNDLAVTKTDDATLSIANISTGSIVESQLYFGQGFKVCVSPNRKYLAIVEENLQLLIWDLTAKTKIVEYPDVRYCDFSSNSKYVLLLGGSLGVYDISLVDISTSKRNIIFKSTHTLSYTPTDYFCKFFPNQTTFAVGTGSLLMLWHARPDNNTYFDLGKEKLEGVTLVTFVITINNDIIYCPANQHKRILYNKNMKDQLYFDGHKESIMSLTLSPCSNYLYSADSICIKIWHIQNRKCLTTLDISLPSRTCVFSPNGKYFASGSNVWKTNKQYWIQDSESILKANILEFTSKNKISIEDIELTNQILGENSVGLVKKGFWTKSVEVAVTEFHIQIDYMEDSDIISFNTNIEMLSKLRHSNIVSIFGYYLKNDSLFYVCEYSKDYTLADALKNGHQLNLLSVAMEICQGMSYLHKNNIIHRYLTPMNIFVLENSQVKIRSFETRLLQPANNSQSSFLNENISYCAPELFKQDPNLATNKVDVFSFGLILWQMYTRETVWADLKNKWEIIEKICSKIRPVIPNSVPILIKILISDCWVDAVDDRPTFNRIYDKLASMNKEKSPKGNDISNEDTDKSGVPAAIPSSLTIENDTFIPTIENNISPNTNPASKSLSVHEENVSKLNSSESKTKTETKDHTQIVHSKLEISTKVIGEGSFGEVYLGMYYKLPVAIKKLKRSKFGDRALEDFKNETKILATLQHSFIVSCYGYALDDDPLIVLEYMPNGNLFNWIYSQKTETPLQVVLKFLTEIALGMHYLHSRIPQIIHRDLKSLNVLLGENLTLKITDFGLSKTKEHSQMSNTAVNTIGTIPWTAPEYLTLKRRAERNEKGDVYSFAVIAWELLSHKVPWKEEGYNADDVKEAVLQGDRLKIPQNCPPDLKELIVQCWQDNPKQRPSFEAIINMLASISSTTTETDSVKQVHEPLTDTQIEIQQIKERLLQKKKELSLEDTTIED